MGRALNFAQISTIFIRMKISKIRVKHFKSFMDETTIDFTELQGMWWISGHIGAGKTTIGEAIIYGLYGTVSGKNNGALITWGQKHGLVELWCQSKGKNIYIKRELNTYGQSPMSVEVDGEPIVFTNKRNAQQQLEQDYLDTPRTTMELLCIISFNNFKSLSTLNTKDTKIFLDQVLGFDTLTAYIDACKEEMAELRQEMVSVIANKTATNNQIDRMSNYKFIDGDPIAIKKTIEVLQAEISTAETERDVQVTPMKEELAEENRKLIEVKALGTIKRKEIDFIKKGKCPTCGAPIDQSALETKEREREVLIDTYKTIDVKIRDLQARITEIITESTNYINEKRSLVKSQENELVRLNEQAKHTQVNQAEIDRLKKELEEYDARINQISAELTEYDRLVQIFQVQIRSQVLDSFIPSLNSKIKELAGMMSLRYVPEYDSMFKCSIRSNNSELIPISSLSTGQLKMVDMVIILAVIGSLVSKVSSNVIFLDELFGNLDPATRSELIGVLRATIPAGSTVMIVSHQTMDDGLFDGRLKMKLVPDESGIDKTEISIS